MAGDDEIDVKQLEKDKKELAAELDKLRGEMEKLSKSHQAIHKQLDSKKLDTKAFEEQLKDAT